MENEFTRRVSISPVTKFQNPFIVYKVVTEKAFEYALNVLEYLLLNINVNTVFVEDIKKLNIEALIAYKTNENQEFFNKKLINESKVKIKNFVKRESCPDLCIVIGGDGTTLWTNHLFETSKKPPFLNFNLGTLGYMAIYSCSKYEEVLNELYSNEKLITFEKRSTLNVNILRSEAIDANTNKDIDTPSILISETNALNEVTIERAYNSNCISLKIYLNDEPLTVIKSDGLIISTSTGSTAYNLSAGGGVLHYDVDALILNAICPMSLSFRTITFPRGYTLKIVPCSSSYNKAMVNVDCIDKNIMQPGDHVEISLSNNYVYFIVLEKFVKNRTNLWRTKIVDQLGWNNAFKNFD